jgi:hypothetical protein
MNNLENHINRNSTIISQVTTLIDSLSVSKRDFYKADNNSSESFTYTFETPIKRVSSIEITNINLPDTFWNCHRGNVKLIFNNQQNSGDEHVMFIDDIQNNNIADFIAKIQAAITAVLGVHFSTSDPILVIEYDTLLEKKVCFKFDKLIPQDYAFFEFTGLFKNLGFRHRTSLTNSAISTDAINSTNNKLSINATNDTLVISHTTVINTPPNLTSSFTIKFKHTTYSMQNIAFIINTHIPDGNCKFLQHVDKIIITPILSENLNNDALRAGFTISGTLVSDLKLPNNSSYYALAPDYPIKEILELDPTHKNYNVLTNQYVPMDYTSFRASSSSTNIEEGKYDISDLNGVFPLLGYTVAYNTKKQREQWTDDSVNSSLAPIYNTGLMYILGGPNSDNKNSLSKLFFTYINPPTFVPFLQHPPRLFTTHINIHSREISRIRNTQAQSNDQNRFSAGVWSVPYPYQHAQIINKTTHKILLSRKETIESLDFYFTDERGDIMDFGGANVIITLILNTS